MDHLDKLENESIYVIREAYNKFKNLTMLWSMGKDSTVLLWIVKKAFFGHIPFPMIHVDTEKKFAEMYEFRERLAKEWNFKVIIGKCPPIEKMDQTLPAAMRSAARKTDGLKSLIAANGFDAIIAGIRKDEEGTRAKERFFSPRGADSAWDFKNQPPEFWNQFMTDLPVGAHMRVHPLLQWSELDVWEYMKREKIPLVPLYFAKNGKRYRSLGDHDITFPIDSNASTIDEIIDELKQTKQRERSGRAQDQEDPYSMQKLREKGYM